MADSTTKQFNTARKANPSLKFADFQKTLKSTPRTAQNTKVFQSQTAINKAKVGLSSDIIVEDPNKITQAEIDAGIKSKTEKLANGSISRPGVAPLVPTKTLQDVRDVSAERGEAQAIKQGQVKGEGEVFDPFSALQGRQLDKLTGKGKGEAVSPFVAEGRAKAIRDKTMEKVGEQPVLEEPEGGYKSVEEKLEAEKNHQTQLADWWRRVGEESQKELGDVSSKFGTLQDQMNQYQGAIDALVTNLNTVNPGTGTELSGILSEIQKTGGGNITPEILTKIQQLGESGMSAQDFKSQVRALLTTGVQDGSLAAVGATDNGDSFSLSNGVTFPKGGNGLPMLDVGSIPPNANSYDVALMELATNNNLAVGSFQDAFELIQSLSNTVERTKATAKVEANNVFDTASNKVDEQKLHTLNEQKYNKMKSQIAKDTSLENILEEEAKMEGYMRGTLEAWGADRSTAGLAVMGNIKLKFLKQYASTAQGYDVELARASELETEARMFYTNRSIEIANDKALALEKIDNNYLDGIDKIFEQTSTAFRNRDLKFLTNNTNYFKQVQTLRKEERDKAEKNIKDTKDFNFNLMKEYASQSGLQWEIREDGTIGMVLDENGYPVPTRLASEFATVEARLSDDDTPVKGSGAFTIDETTEYLSNVSGDWMNSVGNGNVITGSPWEHGIDIDGQIGDPITSPVSGTVVRATSIFGAQDAKNITQKGFGNNVVIRTEDGKYVQLSHLDTVSVSTKDGENMVEAGQNIGTMGNTGAVIPLKGGDGSHLDVTMWKTFETSPKLTREADFGDFLRQKQRELGMTLAPGLRAELREEFEVLNPQVAESLQRNDIQPEYANIANIPDKWQSVASGDAQEFVTKILRLLPVKLKDSPIEVLNRSKEAFADYNKGRGIQEVVDEMNGFVIQDDKNRPLALSLRSYASGTDLPLSEISSPMNLNNPIKAMTNVENANLKKTDRDFNDTILSQNVVKRTGDALTLLSDPLVANLTGQWDSRKLRWDILFPADATDEVKQKAVRLGSILTDMSKGIRKEFLGSAMTPTEVRSLKPFITSMEDQPSTIVSKLQEMTNSVMAIHNSTRNTVGLPLISPDQLIDNDLRLEVYKNPGETVQTDANIAIGEEIQQTQREIVRVEQDIKDGLYTREEAIAAGLITQ